MSTPPEAPPPDDRRRYEDALERAMCFAERHVAWDQALEIAHDVACVMVRRPPEEVTTALIHRAVINRVRNLWRSRQRRAEPEQLYQDERAEHIAARVDPSGRIEMLELRAVIDATIAAMPQAMCEALALVRDDGLTYREAAAQLGVAAGTIHTQLSRANALLRRAIDDYRAQAAPTPSLPSTGRAR
jgi:RNA polymerase sigma factor (sigma-70 family)